MSCFTPNIGVFPRRISGMDLPDDVDSLKQLVRSLKQQLTRTEGMDRFRLVVESAPNGIIVSNREGRIVMTRVCSKI